MMVWPVIPSNRASDEAVIVSFEMQSCCWIGSYGTVCIMAECESWQRRQAGGGAKLAEEVRLANKDINIDEVIEMALSDHTAFAAIEKLYGLNEAQVKQVMRQNLKRGSYEAWRRRVRTFSDRREHYKESG